MSLSDPQGQTDTDQAHWSLYTSLYDSSYTAPIPVPLTQVAFDPDVELVWTADEKGRIASYLGPELIRYSAFRAHASSVRHLQPLRSGVLSIAADSVRLTNRRGLAQWTVSEPFGELYTGCVAANKDEVVVTGLQRDALLLSMARGTIIRRTPCDGQITMMHRGDGYILGGGPSGHLSLRDIRTLKVEKTLQAHTGSMSDITMTGYTMATCGFSMEHGSLQPEPVVKLFDVRTFQPISHIPFPAIPTLLRGRSASPSYTGGDDIMVGTQTGGFQVLNVKEPTKMPSFYQSISSSLASMDLSSSGELIALVDSTGMLQSWSSTEDPQANALLSLPPLPTDSFIPPASVHPHIPDPVPFHADDAQIPLNAHGVPDYDEPLLSALHPQLTCEPSRPADPIDPHILSSMRKVDFIGYAQNPLGPRRLRQPLRAPTPSLSGSGRDGAPETGASLKDGTVDGRPDSRNSITSSSSSSSRGKGPFSKGHLAQFLQGTTMPKYYKIFEIKYSRFGVEDFDFGFYNQTRFGGLETHIAHSYCNALLQSLFFLPALRALLVRHSGSACSRDPCLSCELGFLFSMLQDSGGRNCHASNFLRAFSAIPQVSALGLFEPEIPDASTSYAALVQSLNRFLLEQIHFELTTPQTTSGKGSGKRSSPPASSSSSTATTTPSSQSSVSRQSDIQGLFGISTDQTSRCGMCKHESSRSSLPFSLDLSYTYDNLGSTKLTNGLVEALHAALSREGPGKAWCGQCKAYRATVQQRSVLAPLPPYLVINTTAVQKADGTGWMGLKRGQSLPWLPTHMALTVDGPNGAEAKPGVDLEGMGPSAKVYALQSCISQIQPLEEIPHLVSHIHTSDPTARPEATDNWHLFNDFLVRPIPQEEVTSIDASWRLPALVFYVERARKAQSRRSPPTSPDLSVLYKEYSVANKGGQKKVGDMQPLTPEEVQPGMLVAIDAEFIALSQEETEVRRDGAVIIQRPQRQGLARVSVVRGELGPRYSVPLMDDYIVTTEPVVDYLTEFSGIQEGDLDPAVSTRTLVPLKYAYKKLRLLLDAGCVFIGHGLRKDFRIINILVPPSQVIDTVDIFHIKDRQRKISLRFLAWCLLDQHIQTGNHDSIEDARTALAIYHKYLELEAEGTFEQILEDIYVQGWKYNWKPPAPPTEGSSTDTATTTTTDQAGMPTQGGATISSSVSLGGLPITSSTTSSPAVTRLSTPSLTE
ncbi:ubiquitin carboxyl-terminal hydrolase-domain-containing protein [Piptocephalis cylindrospora]|uniref:PAN2-PAN3 deadenylation complex catalytic subunit PAN2 n=1 Tax=Piptocephalis cylindrospora TaxID=1907219 RepID=A0A4P9Y6E4_9FUNG|nr:ubiquitin carboxyl-terminal hydrolase-domain-containing protein [Piptocephalis cylindrospora]|eukprot:RKP14656.1 ubiquitin carboxyl-terminal hydrolase-domain-containing protein [Piptocephalis cylindrospora]